jgi:CheY-like chemotaxis protein
MNITNVHNHNEDKKKVVDQIHSLSALKKLNVSKKKVLFIEDDEDFREVLVQQLENYLDVKVTVAQDPYEAINNFVDDYFDFVILDWNLPEMNGKETLKEAEFSLSRDPNISFKWDKAQVPVVVLSGFDKKNYTDLNSGFFRFAGFVTKNQSLEGIMNNLMLSFDSENQEYKN